MAYDTPLNRPALASRVGAAIVTGCGAEVPSNSVAKVGGDDITKAEFNKWLKTAARGQTQGGRPWCPTRPNYTKCVAAKQKQPVQKGAAEAQPAQLKTQCKQEFDRSRARSCSS